MTSDAPALLLIDADTAAHQELIEFLQRVFGESLAHRRIDDHESLTAALATQRWDLIIAEAYLPHFDALKALRLLARLDDAPPLLVFTDQIDTRAAVAAMSLGALTVIDGRDYTVLQDFLRDPGRSRESTELWAPGSLARDAQLRALLQEAPLGLALYERDHEGQLCCTYTNPFARQLDLRPGSQPQLPSEILASALRRAIDAHQSATLHAQAFAKQRVVDVRILPLSGGVVGMLCDDVSERARLEVQVRAAQRMDAVGRLASGVAHDFNNLLTAIFCFGQFAKDAIGTDHKAYNDVDEVLQAAQRARNLTRQLLAFSRRRSIDPRVVKLDHSIENMRGMLKRIAGDDVQLVFRLESHSWNTWIDPSALEQVLVNLVVNARDAMARGGRIEVRSFNSTVDLNFGLSRGVRVPEGDYLVLEVADEGSGMSAQTLARVFEPFFTTKAEGEGTGLGLATCYGIVKQAGGYIWADSQEDEGATFSVYLPRTLARVEARATQQVELSDRGSESILVLEDDPQVRQLMVRSLSEQGYKPLGAATADDAERWANAQSEPFDLLIADVVTPGTNGQSLARALRSSGKVRRVLLTSGHSLRSLDRYGVAESYQGLLHKPFTTVDLLRQVRQVLDDKRTQRRPDAKLRVLVVDDNPKILSSIQRAYGQRFNLEIAHGGDEALNLIRESETGFDLVVVDVVMPGIDGPLLVQLISQEKPDYRDRIVFLTGDPEALPDHGDLPTAPVLQKPFEPDALEALAKVGRFKSISSESVGSG